jgi:TolB-like protein
VSLGEAARKARHSLLQAPAQPTSFGGYVLYGDPRATLPAESARLAPSVSVRSSGEVPAQPAVTSVAPPRSPAGAPPTPPAASVPVPAFAPVVPARAVRLPLPAVGAAVGGLLLAGGGLAFWLGRSPHPAPEREGPPPVAVPAADPQRHTGPLRVSVLPFKNVSGEAPLDHLKDALAEAVVTDLGGVPDTRLIERGQLDLDLGELEFSQTRYVDPATRAALGKIHGAEVVVIGGYQRVGGQVRVNARLVDAETGEILRAMKVERPEAQLFDLQDAVTAELRQGLGAARARLRP